MRTAIAITLIICGTALVALPPFSDFMFTQTQARLLDRPDARSVTLAGQMSGQYRFGCFALGAMMMLTAVASPMAVRQGESGVKASRHPAVA